MTSCDLNIDLTRMFYVKVVDLSTTYQMPLAVCRFDVWFFISEGGGAERHPAAQNRTFQSSPGKELNALSS